MDLITHEFKDQSFKFIQTVTAKDLIDEIFSDNYKILEKNIKFNDGDIIVDLGACEGMFSIMMSKLFPQTKIISLEPVPSTYYNLVKNIELNECKNIDAVNLGVGKYEDDFMSVVVNKSGHAGGSTSFCTFNPDIHEKTTINIISLDELFDIHDIKKCKLLKIDVEGAEYDALYNSSILYRVENLVGELHVNTRLQYESRRPDGLANWLNNQTNVIHLEICKMAE